MAFHSHIHGATTGKAFWRLDGVTALENDRADNLLPWAALKDRQLLKRSQTVARK